MKQLYFILAFAFPFAVIAQRDLPQYPTESEIQLPPEPRKVPGEASLAPPPVPVRTMAEWEEVESIVVSWNTTKNEYKLILAGIIGAVKNECVVIICVPNQSVIQDVTNVLLSQGIALDKNIEIRVVPNNTIWVRDYGPNSVYANGVDSLLLIDWIYNRTGRKLDDSFSFPLAKSLNASVYTTFEAPEDLVHTGGNFMTDGLGTAFSSRLILEENKANNLFNVTSKSENEVNTIMQQYMGINRYIKMETLPYDGIHHIDMHMKLLDEETLLVGQYPTGISDGPQIEANLQYVLNNYKSVYGTPYKVARIPMPSFSGGFPPYLNPYLYPTYANALIVNKTVIMPSYNQPSDQAAIDTFKRYMPGYNIVPVYCRDIVKDGGAVHCITKEIGVREPLQIVHQPLRCQGRQNDGYVINARINHKSGIANAKVWYTTDLGKPWQSVNMTGLGGHALYNYKGVIPRQAEGSQVYYYIESEAFSGKKLTRPLTASKGGYWNFCIEKSLSSEEPSSAELLDIFPNPASAITAIPILVTNNTVAQIAMYDALGRLMEIIHDGELPSGKQHYFVDASKYAAGMYFISFRTNKQLTMKHLIIR